MKKQLLIALMIFMFGYPTETILGLNNETNINKIVLKAQNHYGTTKAKGRGTSSISTNSVTTLNLDAYVDGNTITIYFNSPIAGNTTITIKDIYEDIIHIENVVVSKPMEITITLNENDLDNYLLEIESSSVYIYGML